MAQQHTVDALVVGAGMGGIYSTYRLSRMGLHVQCIDLAGDVGGTWYINRYPGAMSDTETYIYRYSWDKEDLQTYPWTHHYIYQPQILEYLNHVVKKHDLRKYMRFNTEMTGAVWEEDIQRWRVTTKQGTEYVARYLVNSLGILSTPNYPTIPGINDFKGEKIHTSSWPEGLDLKGKHVGVIGNGSTGVQVMTALAPVVKQLISFQRNPQYSVPSGQKPIHAGYRDEVNATYDQIWDNVFGSFIGFNVPESTRKCMEATPEERQQAFQEVWDKGNGFRFMFSAFGDITTSEEANEEACKFIKGKIDEIVKDPIKARRLKPTEIYARRPLCDSGYYQIFNLDHVDIVNLKETPITKIVPTGIQTEDGQTHEMDVLVFATGFDALEGSYLRLNIVGKNGETISEHWKDGPRAYGGIACAGFPNMFLISGPQGPFANFPPVIESETNFIMSCIEYAERNIAASGNKAATNGVTNGVTNGITNGTHKAPKPTIMEVTHAAETGWNDECERLTRGSLFKRTSSWIFGANVKRKQSTKFYFAGLKAYLDWKKSVIEGDFADFKHE